MDVQDIKKSILVGDVFEQFRKIPDRSIDVVVTSPPYYGLRDYGFDGQIGTEETYQEYLHRLMRVMTECARVLKSTGSCWVNIDDTYSGAAGIIKKRSALCVPERFAVRCVDNGWVLHNRCVWIKKRPMPYTHTNRLQHRWEYLYFFSRGTCFFNLDEIRVPHTTNRKPGKKSHKLKTYNRQKGPTGNTGLHEHQYSPGGKNPGDVMIFPPANLSSKCAVCVWGDSVIDFRDGSEGPERYCSHCGGSWILDHGAAFPWRLPEYVVRAACPPGGVVLDPFLGSGSTALAAEVQGRAWCGIEASPDHVSYAVKRLEWFRATGKTI